LDALLKVNIQDEDKSPNLQNPEENVIAGFVELPIDKVFPNPNQPRKNFSEEALESLAVSIKSFGVIQPITVAKKDDIYEIIAGERRYRAAKKVGLEKIPVIIKDLSQKEKMEISLVENIQRENLNPIEEGLAFLSLIETYSITQEELSGRLGKSRTAITNTIRLLNLDPQIQKWITEEKLTPGHARTILSVEDKSRRISFADYIIKNNLSVREAEQISKKWPLQTFAKKDTPKVREIEIQRAEEKIARKLMTKVNIVGTSLKGKINIEYFKQEDLERILEILDVSI
nr:ParB/RepB/Spo0J family partition protein [Spirochaetota bacterium]